MSEPSIWRSVLAGHASSRSCGACDLCCTVMEVRELGKDAFAPCPQLAGAGRGCRVWGEHPGACQAFACLWRGSDALLPPDLFPADCGFMLALDTAETWPTVVKVCAEAARPSAWDTPRNRALFSGVAAAWNCPVAVIGPGVRASHVFAPTGGVYARAERPEIFPNDGAGLALALDDWDPDRRPPAERIAQAGFGWASLP